MRSAGWVVLAALMAAAAARKPDQDFEFDDDALETGRSHARRPRRYVYDPHNTLCSSLVCKKREICLLRDSFTALCATKKDILRKGDVIVTGGGGGGGGGGSGSEEEADEVFYEARAGGAEEGARRAGRCVGCGGGARAQFLCGSDNRTYSSLCRLDLHNCVRRPAPPVALACRGFCPCRARRPARGPIAVDQEWRRRKSESAHNEVLPDRPTRRRFSQGSEGCALDKMANRLLDWFSVLMEEAGATPPPAELDGFPSECKPEVRWMFAHLDTDGDGVLSAANLYSLRHDERERCLRPFLASCGGGGGGGVSRGAWCGCLRRAARPCLALARAHGGAARAGGYVPACDARGYYRARQCHAALGVCWCVDAHGVELAGSRTKGAPACDPDPPAPEDDEDAPGSGDGAPDAHY